jgi:uncharacterized membrane protein (UPF0127 family)
VGEVRDDLWRPSAGRGGVPRAAAAVGLALLLAACSGGDPSAGPSGSPATTPTVGQRIADTVEAELGGVPLRLEVADEPQERAVGLMGRTQVPPGTGMVFRFDQPSTSKFYMFQVPVPLTAVFLRDGTVVHVAQMEPCTEPDGAQCPLYGPDDEAYDTVVETAPGTLPDVQPGDRLEYG